MKRLLLSLTVALLAGPVLADIQEPPMRAHTPGRKLGRAVANLLYSSTELGDTMHRVNELEGNSAAVTYGLVKGVGRWAVRMGAGAYELFTFPFPVYKRSYRPVLKSNIPWVYGGYEEFPPEVGFQTRKNYSTTSDRY